jgi:CheY-like chemotaxis protein
MDIQMPKLSGIDAAKQIRQFEATHNLPRIKIIALTANAMDSEKMECFEAGIDLFISKPITPEKLAKTFLL